MRYELRRHPDAHTIRFSWARRRTSHQLEEASRMRLLGKVNRKDWGLNWNMVLAGGGLVAGDEITLAIDLELTRTVEAAAVAQAQATSA